MKTQKKLKKIDRRKILISVAAAVLIVACGWFIAHQIQVHNERENFMQAKADLHAVAEQIIAQVGQPAEEKAIQSCGYTSVVFGRGTRFCSVDEYLLYRTRSLEESQTFVQVSSATIKHAEILTYRSDDSYTQISGNYTSLKYENYTTSRGLGCDASYYDVTKGFPYGTPFVGVPSSHGFLLHLNCSSGALAQYFPVQQ